MSRDATAVTLQPTPQLARMIRQNHNEMHEDLSDARKSIARALNRADLLGWPDEFKQALRKAAQAVADVAVPILD